MAVYASSPKQKPRQTMSEFSFIIRIWFVPPSLVVLFSIPYEQGERISEQCLEGKLEV